MIFGTKVHPIETLLGIDHHHHLSILFDLHSVVEHDFQTLIPEVKQDLTL